MKGIDKDKIKEILENLQKKLLMFVLIFAGMEIVATLIVGLPVSAVMFHTGRLKDGIEISDFFVFSDLLQFRTWLFSFVLIIVA